MERFSVMRENEVIGSGQNSIYMSPLKVLGDVISGMLNKDVITVTPLGEVQDTQIDGSDSFIGR